MQEIRHDGTERLSTVDRGDYGRIRRAIEDPRNASVRIHKPGAIFETHDGMRRRFRVRDDGSLERLRLDGTDLPWEQSAP